MGFLTDLIESIRRELDQHPPDDVALMARATAMPPARPFEDALRAAAPPALIAEVKRASPSAGEISTDANPSVLARAYEAGGAAAISVLTEPRHFHGALTDPQLQALLSTAGDLGLGTLVETHSDEDLRRALATDAPVIGVNARDLETLDVDAAGARARIAGLPDDRLGVLESGIAGRGDVDAAIAAGASAILVGEALMRADDPARAVRKLVWKELRTT